MPRYGLPAAHIGRKPAGGFRQRASVQAKARFGPWRPVMAILLLAMLLLGGRRAEPAVAAESQAAADMVSTDENASHVSLLPSPKGGNALLVEYPWQTHRQASLEICVVPNMAETALPRRPLRLVSSHVRGDAKADYYRAWDRGSAGAAVRSLPLGDATWDLIAGINWRGTSGVCATRKIFEKDAVTATWAVFWPLEPWSVDSRELRLELPPGQFREAGQMHVWFLRGEKVLWQQRLSWPGEERR